MIDEAHTRLASPRQTDHVIHVDDLAVEDVAGQRRDAFAAGGDQAPALAALKLELVFADIDPEEAEAGNESAVGYA